MQEVDEKVKTAVEEVMKKLTGNIPKDITMAFQEGVQFGAKVMMDAYNEQTKAIVGK